ncbi:hypothetical protein AX15_006255 [Amanita polypyramis BW_CC]|nr:hypothetical protein AX15_006255 [Amanita polypyramis BW_CC]
MSDEYEVEAILKARVEKKRGKQLIMKFCVRWKGYGPEDDTWEPVESFEGSEGIIERFWERANSEGRNFRDLSQFKAGEVFVPMGPPRRKRKRDDRASEQSTPSSPAKSGRNEKTRVRTEPHTNEIERPSKRSREGRTGSKRRVYVRSPIPGNLSEMPNEDDQKMVRKTPLKSPKVVSSPPARQSRRASRRIIGSPESILPSDEDDSSMHDGSLFGSPVQQTEALPDDAPASPSPQKTDKVTEKPPIADSSLAIVKKPLHRSAKPLIRFVDEPYLPATEGAISVKARLMGRRTSETRETNEPGRSPPAAPSRSRTGFVRPSVGLKKNASSLLTFENGSLKTVKGRYNKEEKIMRSEPETILADASDSSQNTVPPRPDELLQLAGLDVETADLLASYEEGVTAATDKVDTPNLEDMGKSQSLNDAKDKLLPSGSTVVAPQPSLTTWRRSTIFDPLTRGINPDDGKELPSKLPGSIPFWLNLDHSFSIPVHLSISTTIPTDSTTRKSMRAGVFYKEVHAVDIFKFVHTDGSPGTVDMDPDAEDKDKNHYEHFRTRLSEGDLFIVPAGIDVLAFWSADNIALAELLNIPPTLNNPGNLLFSKIIVDDYSAYSEFVTHADPVPWLQYMSNQ